MKKKIMIIGPRQVGKSTLANLLNHTDKPLRKTQDAIFGEKTIDVPAAYLENTMMYKYIIALAQLASHVVMLVDQSMPTEVFRCPTTGVIMKSDLKSENYIKCVDILKRIGLQPPFFPISKNNMEEIDKLEKYLLSKRI